MKKLLKKMMLALAGVGLVLGMAGTSLAAETCRWGPADRAVNQMLSMNSDAASKHLLASDSTHASYIDVLVEFYNSLPPQDETVDRGAVTEVVILDKPGASTIVALFLGEKCFLGGTLVPKNGGPRMPLEQGA